MAKKGYFSAKNVAWRELPSGYTQVEYIESSGSQYIDAGFKPNNNTRVVMDFQFVSTPSDHAVIFGARDSSTSKNFCVFYVTSGYFRSDYNASNTQQWAINSTARYIIDKNKETTSLNGTTQSYSGATFYCSYNMYLFALNGGGYVYFPSNKLRVFSCQIYDNGTLIRDFVPCKNQSGVAGLYDTVSGVFFENAGTGSFLAGNQVHNDVAREPKKVYFSDNGVARKAKKAYFGDENGIARRWYASGITWAKYSCTRSGGTYYQQDYSNYGTQKTIGVSKGKTISSIGSNYTFSASTGFSLTDKWTCPYGIDEYWKIGGEVKGKYYLNNNTIWVIDGAYRDESYSGSEEYGLFIDCVGISKAVQRPYVYSKGSTLYGKITVDEGKLPESGTVIEGSVEKGYYVLKIGSTYYYYEIV